ncbi:5-dehydro-4-deoxy-D-glucuronate isomerase [Vibrio sp. S11_S32]|uniref:5-dehydro-4-deoxy-D-glucuronate isomerase n=1 Tax=Vibrio sp. S11_S32 TaxID=2720225 RepID=UPI0016807F92|nr:5-dehydro-4-deoxy-D-glucuronate isomerase [Vibrio sp. S11_S32]MBD1577524.1 5-dehydro-4-deoxy-D-glucuronate isomerase [Vibrio sp. S11_S32]
MIIRQASNLEDAKQYDTDRLRQEFLIESLFQSGTTNVIYSHIDRIVAVGACPTTEPLTLASAIDNKAFGTDFFLQRREIGIVNLGGKAEVTCGNETYILDHLDCVYLGQGSDNIHFHPSTTKNKAQFYALSTPAHHSYPNKIITKDQANKISLGSDEMANQRLLTQYIHPDILQTCQLCMGITHLSPGSVWNTMPAHTHERRMEIYCYFNIKPQQAVFHMMGEPTQTRHIIVQNNQLVLSPSWSIHSGCGTQNYSFVWGMAGENQTFDDMDFVETSNLR